MRELFNYYTVAVEKIYEDDQSVTPAGIIKLNATWIDKEEADRFRYKRLHGILVSGPFAFDDTVVGVIDPGVPEPKAYISNDQIEARVQTGDQLWDRKDYNPSTWNGFEVITIAEYAKRVNVRENELVYFMETVTEPENFIGKDPNGLLLYRCRVDQIICAIREDLSNPGNKKPVMQGNWVLVEPDMETWEEITTDSGIIMKQAPEAKPLRATVKHIGPNNQVSVGDLIYYLPDSNWGLTVEGVEYFGIKDKEIILKAKKHKALLA